MGRALAQMQLEFWLQGQVDWGDIGGEIKK
jgi:hypothetical protein